MLKILLCLLGSVGIALCAESAPDAKFEPWKEPAHRLKFEEVAATLKHWAAEHPDILTLETRGKSVGGHPLYLLKATDPGVQPDDKQIILISSFHSGGERSGCSSAMRFVEWLLSGDPLARETLKKQIVLIMPVLNPDGFIRETNNNDANIDPYTARRGALWDITAGGLALKEPENVPEAAAFLGVVDEYKPEVTVDLHGVSGGWRGMQTLETAGPAGSNMALRPWDARVSERLIQAANAAGYGIFRMEMDDQRLFFGDQMKAQAGKFWWGRPFFYTQMASYLKYHALPITLEINWEDSALARLKEILRIGNETWEGENRPGYPVNVMKGGVCQLMAGGRNDGELRKSREELWNRQDRLPLALLTPWADGRCTALGILTSHGAALLAKSEPVLPAKISKEDLLNFVANAPGVDREKLTAYLKAGPENTLFFDMATGLALPMAEIPETPIRSGLAFRFRIPYQKVAFREVALNGFPLKQSDDFGYAIWVAGGFTHLQVNLPPEEAEKLDFALITLSYTPADPHQQGWMPPATVLESLKTKSAQGDAK